MIRRSTFTLFQSMPLLTINGSAKEVSSTVLDDLFRELGLPAALLLVEYNGRALHRSEWSGVLLSEGDRLELLSVAAGG
jgi:thiamine biosynthesis protein ThiS